MKVNKERAYAQRVAVSLKSRKIAEGTEFTTQDVVEGSYQQGNQTVPNDIVMTTDGDGKIVRIPMRELLKMTIEGGVNVLDAKQGEAEASIPDKFRIVSSTDRQDRNGNVVYPINAYKLGQDFLDKKVSGWDTVVAGGLKEDNTLEPVQNYVIAVL
jgi:hypothetical protein